jgi:hypothetical protein
MISITIARMNLSRTPRTGNVFRPIWIFRICSVTTMASSLNTRYGFVVGFVVFIFYIWLALFSIDKIEKF